MTNIMTVIIIKQLTKMKQNQLRFYCKYDMKIWIDKMQTIYISL